MDRSDCIMITGGTGFLGCSVIGELTRHGYLNLVPLSSKNGDLKEKDEVQYLLNYYKPNVIIHLAAKVGGIGANRIHPGEFFYDNMLMGLNLIDAANTFGIKKFIQIGTVCAYPKYCEVPFHEDKLWDGYPEETNAPYGIAKKALLVMLQAYRQEYYFNGIYLLPVNLYGPNDNFDPAISHIIPALILKIDQAKQRKADYVEVWGTGHASREFLYVKDCARAIRLAMESYDEPEPVNLGYGEEIRITDLVKLLCELMDYKGDIHWDTSKPDGQPRRCLDTERAFAKFGFEAKTSLRDGLKETIEWFYRNKDFIQC